MPYYTTGPIWRNDFGALEGDIMEYVIPLNSPELEKFHPDEKGEMFHSDGRKLVYRPLGSRDGEESGAGFRFNTPSI